MTPSLATLLAVSVAVIAAISVLVLIFLIPVLIQVCRAVQELRQLVNSVRAQVAPITREIGVISHDIRGILEIVHRQVNRVEEGIEAVNCVVSRARALQLELQSRIERPVLALSAVLGGVKRGANAFARILGL